MNAQTGTQAAYKRKTSIQLASGKQKSNLKLAVQTSSITPLVDGPEIFAEIGNSIINAKDYIYISGWMIHLNLKINGKSLKSLLLKKSSQNVKIKILWADLDPNAGQFNEEEAKKKYAQSIESIQANRLLKEDKSKNIEVIVTEMSDLSFDGRILQEIATTYMNRKVLIGSHHQKFVVVDGTTAIVGGIDLTVHSAKASKWHDVSVRIFGKGVRGIENNFVTRWNKEKLGKYSEVTLNPKSKDSPRCKTILTLPSWYWSNTEILNQYIELINSAKSSIYIENQYIRESGISKVLLDAVLRGINLTIIIPTLPEEIVNDGKKPQLHNKLSVYIQYRMLKTLTTQRIETLTEPYKKYSKFQDKQNNRLKIFSPSKKNKPYIHAKIMVVDEEYTIIGSANLNGKSLVGSSDSELGVFISSKDFARNLKEKLSEKSKTWRLIAHNLEQSEKISRFSHSDYSMVNKLINNKYNGVSNADWTDPEYWANQAKKGVADVFDGEIMSAKNPDELRDAFADHRTLLNYL